MGFFSSVFFKGYYYFILYWILDLINSIERDIFEEDNSTPYKETYYNNTNNSNNSNISTNNDNNPYTK